MSLSNIFINTLHHSADLVNGWGLEELSDGRSLKEALTIREISLWDVIAPELSIYHVPKALSLGIRTPSITQKTKPYLSWWKQKVVNLLYNKINSDDCAKWPTEPVYLFLGFNDYIYREALQPVANKLEECKEICTVSLYDGQYSKTTLKLSRMYKLQSIWKHLDDKVKAEADLMCRMFRKVIKRSLIEEELSRIISDQGSSLWPKMKPTFVWLFKVYLPLLLAQAAIAKHIIIQHCPALIVSADGADARARIYYTIGIKRDVPIMEIMFADVVSMDAISWRFFKANHVSVSGDKAKNVIQNFGVPAELITVNGSPRYDSFFDISTDELKKKSARLRNDNVKVMALFASTLSLNAYDKFVDPTILSSVKKTIFQAADQVEKINLVVKPHPLEDVSALKHLATGYRNITFVGAEEDIRELTKICDVFITLGSMSTLGALILRKPVIWPAFSGSIWWEEEDPFIMSGATLVARSMEELVNYLLCLIDGKGDMLLNDIESSRQLFLENWLYRPDGQASYRIASLARRMAAKKIVVDSG